MWCGRCASPQCEHLERFTAFNAWCDRRFFVWARVCRIRITIMWSTIPNIANKARKKTIRSPDGFEFISVLLLNSTYYSEDVAVPCFDLKPFLEMLFLASCFSICNLRLHVLWLIPSGIDFAHLLGCSAKHWICTSIIVWMLPDFWRSRRSVRNNKSHPVQPLAKLSTCFPTIFPYHYLMMYYSANISSAPFRQFNIELTKKHYTIF